MAVHTAVQLKSSWSSDANLEIFLSPELVLEIFNPFDDKLKDAGNRKKARTQKKKNQSEKSFKYIFEHISKYFTDSI